MNGELEKPQALELARMIDRHMNGEQRGQDRDVGWALIWFPYDNPGAKAGYMSSADRAQAVRVLREAADALEGNRHDVITSADAAMPPGHA